MSMQHSDYVSQNMFDIINTVEFIVENWDREILRIVATNINSSGH